MSIRTPLTLFLLAGAAPGAPTAASAEKKPPSQRTILLLGEVGAGAPTGLVGLKGGYFVHPTIDLELGFGLGATGFQFALLGRYNLYIGDGPHVVTFALGPSLALTGDKIGLKVAHRLDIDVEGDLYYAAWTNAEVTYAYHAPGGFTFRIGVGVMVTVSENMSHLCDGVVTGRGEAEDEGPAHTGCAPNHFVSAPEIAGMAALPYLTAAAGWRF